jgi:hypothetical protein
MKISSLEPLSNHKALVVLSFLGLASLYFWQPVTQILTGTFHENPTLDLDAEVIKQDKSNQLLIIHVKPANRGGVPVEIGSQGHPGAFKLEVRKIQPTPAGQWLDSGKMEVVSSLDLLRNHKGGYVIEQNAMLDEVEAIVLPLGRYWVKARMEFGGDYYVDQSMVVELKNEK